MKNEFENNEKMSIPEVKFVLPTVEKEAQMLFNFCYVDESTKLNWSETVYKWHPDLKEEIKKLETSDELLKLKDLKDVDVYKNAYRNALYNTCFKYAESFIRENIEKINNSQKHFKKLWDEINEKILTNLSGDFDISYPREINEIEASVSINPICPRNIEKWTFNVWYRFNDDNFKQTCIHEIIHFIYFKKWVKVFPAYNNEVEKKKFNGDNPEWKLSEILVHSIINGNKTIRDVVGNSKSDVYTEWQNIKIGEKKLAEYFGDIYKEHEEGKISFDDFLKKSWEEYKKHEDIIENGMKK